MINIGNHTMPLMRVVRLVTLMVFMLGVYAHAQVQELNSVFDDANKLYLEQKYDAAINHYESILKSGYENGELYFNLGNAYYKSGKIQNAMLNYERAKKFMPNDEDLQFNMHLVELQLIDKVDPIPELFFYQWMNKFANLLPQKTIVILMYLLFLLTLGLFSFFLFAKTYEQKRYTLLAGMFTAVLLVFGVANFFIQSYQQSKSVFAIVMADVSNIKSAPDKKGNDLFVIHKGLKIQVLDNVNQWTKIRLADGKVGWIPQTEVETI